MNPGPPPEDTQNEPVVGVFWDYESCPPPQDHPGSAVVQRIQSIALPSGSIRAFNVYIDLETHRTRLGKGLREEFHSLGVSVLDCPSPKSTKTAADKMIIVDLFTFASANRSALVTLVVISRDPDLAYTLSLLRQRHCKTTVISPSLKSGDTGIASGFQADKLLTWEVVLKDQERPSIGQTKNMPPSGPATISSVPPVHRQNTSEGEAKPLALLAHANARAYRPAIGLGGNARTVGTPTTALNPSPTAPNQQPANISIQTQEFSTPYSSGLASFDPKDLHEIVGLLRTARKRRGWPALEVRRQLLTQRNIMMDERALIEYLEEGVRLGILTQQTEEPSGGRLFPLTFYAVNE
ncbi:hypothetical protein FRC01_014833 [Tulasnella sp. 417]|nr:hypothetical protein FRC01_014833 [Tulasnella sp. 417]